MTISPQAVALVLGGEMTLREPVRSLDDLRKAVERGLPRKALEHAVRRVTSSSEQASELKYRIVPRTTLARRKRRLSPRESEKLERLARMTALAEEVWEDPELAHEFLTSRQPQLGGERPVDLSRSDIGTRQVEALLLKLEYALPA